MNDIDRIVARVGGLRAAWELLARVEAEQRKRVEEARIEQESITRELAA